MKIYSEYLNTIEAAMKADPVNIRSARDYDKLEKNLSKGLTYETFNQLVPEKKLQPSLEQLSSELGLKPNFEQKLGQHPDFAHLKHSDHTEKHYIISMFVDIKGSTNLFKRYTPETVLVITNTLQRAAIHTCLIFGGYVHRLQGDGLFVYFGGKQLAVHDAVLRALQFVSMFSYFVKNDLKNLFNEQGIETIFTRIGIDLGYEEHVVWAMAGIGEISEITTCSLHTSLASKMQSSAPSNGIVVGDHILHEVKELGELFTPVCKRTNNEIDRYIFQIPERKFNYSQYDFNWLMFLKKQSYIATDLSGDLCLKYHDMTIPKIASNLASIASVSKPYYNGNA